MAQMKLNRFVIGMMLAVIPFGELKAQGGNWSPPKRIVFAQDTGVFFTRDSEGVLIEKALDRVILQRMVIDLDLQVGLLEHQIEGLKQVNKVKDIQIASLENDLNKAVQQRNYFEQQAQEEMQSKLKLKNRAKRGKFVMLGLGLVGGYFIAQNFTLQTHR